jgi:hypothetical protein
LDSGGVPVTLPPGPPLPVDVGRVLLDQTHQEVPHAGAEDRCSFRLACELGPEVNTTLIRMTELHERNFRVVYLALTRFSALDAFAQAAARGNRQLLTPL